MIRNKTGKYYSLFLFLAGVIILGNAPICLAQVRDSVKIKPITLSEIAISAADDLQKTRDILIERVQVPTNYNLIPQIDTLETQVRELKELSDQILESNLKFSYYSSLILRWERILADMSPAQIELKKYSSEMESTNKMLVNWHSKWNITLEKTIDENGSEDIVSRINGIINFLDSVNLVLRDSLNSSIALQNRVTDLNLIGETYLKTIKELQKVEIGELLLTRSRPIWNIPTQVDSIKIEEDKGSHLSLGIEDTKVYLNKEWPTLVLLFISYFALLLGFIYLRRSYNQPVNKLSDEEKDRYMVLSKPPVTAFIFTMLLALWWLPMRPLFMKEIFSILFVIPFLPIYQALVFRSIRFSLYYLFAILIYGMVNEYLTLGQLYMRSFSLIESLALFSFHLWFFIAKRRLKNESIKGNLFYILLNTIQPVYFVLTLSAIIANIIGYRNYTDLVNQAVIVSLILLMLFATGFFSLVSLLHFFLHTKAADTSLILRKNKEKIYKWLFRNLRLATIFIWSFYTLRFFYLWIPLTEGVRNVLDTGYQFGSITMTIGDIVNFVLIIYLSWLISTIIRNLLEIEIFGRLNMPRGVPVAVSSLTQYFLIFLGFMLALSAAGFSLQNLSLLAGALGVGIGFGLQNIVNNFISGLILAFERPVTVGDIVNVAGHEGEVQRIGIRASIIKQWDGSEVIVPNAELISAKVVNWTLAKYTRRLILTIQTHLNTDTDEVLQLMKEAAYKVEYVLKDPEAKSYFHGIKDKQMEFALYYWASGNVLDCKSMVNQEVQKTLSAAGISFVMPVHVMVDAGKEQGTAPHDK